MVISGGQTGVDRIALDVAIEKDIPHGGWCPKGRLSEAGRIPDRYQLQEMSSRQYQKRTEANVRDSDGTLILHFGKPTGGTALTIYLVRKYDKPLLKIDLREARAADENRLVRQAVDWIREQRVFRLNVAGPCASSVPQISKVAKPFLRNLLEVLRDDRYGLAETDLSCTDKHGTL